MSLLLGYHKPKHVHPVPTKNYKYTLEYPPITLGVSTYPERGTSGGYRYISTEGFNSETTLTLLLHMFSTSLGKNLGGSVIMEYSLEFVDDKGIFTYIVLRTLDLKVYKVPKNGEKYNHFTINRKFVLSKITGITDFSKYKLFSVCIMQYGGTLSEDTSTLEIVIENVK